MCLPAAPATTRPNERAEQVDLLVIGGGAAGMAAALSAREQGVRSIVIVERHHELGGVLRQCIHDGFGLQVFGESLTGVEFAQRYADRIGQEHIPCLLDTFVLNISADKVVTLINGSSGLFHLKARAIIMAMGCRERTRASLVIPGQRSAGVMTAGTAQRYLNIDGYLPGRRVVILGSGDIGLIMARQFILEDASVECVVEIRPFSSGLPRNISQCLNDFNIPLYFNSTVVDIRGRQRVESVVLAQVDEHLRPIPGSEREIACDTLLISAGLIPENELTQEAGIEMCARTGGPLVDERLETTLPGVFSCGNVLHVHDLVDFVCLESVTAGISAARYLKDSGPRPEAAYIPVRDGKGVNGLVPQRISRSGSDGAYTFMFRPLNIYHDCRISFCSGERLLASFKKAALTPGEICRCQLPAELIDEAVTELCVNIEEDCSR